jgi:hypothetical protein
LPFEPQMLDVDVGNPAMWRPVADRGVVTSSVNRFKKTLSGPEVFLCQTLTTAERAMWSYDPEPVPIRHRLAAIPYVGRAMIDVGVRLFRKWRLGQRHYLRAVLLGYARRLALLRPRMERL